MGTKRKKKNLIVKIIIILLVLLLMVYNGIWFYCYSIYKPFMNAVGKNEDGMFICMDEDKCSYFVSPPEYPIEFYGNLAITDFRRSDIKPGDVLVDMIIWPSINGTYEVGIALEIAKDSEITENKEGGSFSITTKSINIELDEHMNFRDEYSEEVKKLFEENRETIKAYYQKAYNMWGILENP